MSRRDARAGSSAIFVGLALLGGLAIGKTMTMALEPPPDDVWTAQPAAARIDVDAAPSAAEEETRQAQQSYLSGVVYFQAGDYRRARAEWRRALRYDPHLADAKIGLARIENMSASGGGR